MKPEYRAKARFLATFPNFVEWPEGSFSSGAAPFLVCVLGDFRFGTALAELARDASPHGRHIEVRWARKDEELRSCHILFVSNSEANRYFKILKLIKGAGTLTVGETTDFLSAGGMLNFSFQNESLQFEVNLAAANEAHLRVSSRLLMLARRVVSKADASMEKGAADLGRSGTSWKDTGSDSVHNKTARFIEVEVERNAEQ